MSENLVRLFFSKRSIRRHHHLYLYGRQIYTWRVIVAKNGKKKVKAGTNHSDLVFVCHTFDVFSQLSIHSASSFICKGQQSTVSRQWIFCRAKLQLFCYRRTERPCSSLDVLYLTWSCHHRSLEMLILYLHNKILDVSERTSSRPLVAARHPFTYRYFPL